MTEYPMRAPLPLLRKWGGTRSGGPRARKTVPVPLLLSHAAVLEHASHII
jgi:hypothetical protein